MFSMSSQKESRSGLLESESRRKSNKLRLDALSIPHQVIKKGRHHGARHDKTEKQKKYYIVFDALRDEVYRESQLKKWLDRAEVHRDGRVDTARSHVPSIQRGIQEIPRTVLSDIEQIGPKRADATSIRLSRCSLNQKPSPS